MPLKFAGIPATTFTGYDNTSAKTRVLALAKLRGDAAPVEVDKLSSGDAGWIVLEETPGRLYLGVCGMGQRFKSVQEGVPDCQLCEFRKAQRQRLRRGEIDLTNPEVRSRFASHPGFVRQSEEAEQAVNTKSRTPACSWCERLGDTIIALQTERGVAIVTADRTFGPLGELLGRTVILLPSLAELKRRAQDA